MTRARPSGSPSLEREGLAPGSDVVVVQDVRHEVGAGIVVLRDVSLTVGAAELVVLAGRSGSGKSSLLHLMAGASSPTQGTVEVLGRPATDWSDWAVVSLAPQRSAVSPELSVAENVGLAAALRGLPLDEVVLDSFGLTSLADRPATDTSLGEQQRVSLARALVLRPTVALLDEPTGHQDDEHVDLVLAALRAAVDRGSALVVATHDTRVIDLADRVIHLAQGAVVD